MDLPQVGAHCAVPSCNLLDFLPFACQCKQIFCRDHIFPDNHACTAVSGYQSSGTSTAPPLNRCALEDCQRPTLYAFTIDPQRETCDKCHGSFCVQHRYPDTHQCSPVDITSESPKPESSARALLKKNFGSKLAAGPSPSRLKAKKLPTDPVKLAQYKKVELMKLRHRAAPADSKDKGNSPPVDQRLTVNVLFNETEKPFWFRKTVSTGKAIDLLSSQFQVNPSKLLTTALHTLDLATGEQTALRNDNELAKQVEDGATLVLLQTSPQP